MLAIAKHNKQPKARCAKHWEECFAKLVLEKVLPDRFFQLEIADKPDLQNTCASIGVEVTTAVGKAEKEKDHLFSLLVQKLGTPEQQRKSKERIRQLGGIYCEEGAMVSWVGYRDLAGIYSSLEDKLKKLNGGGYRSFEKQAVFITDNNTIKTNELCAVQTELSRRQEPFNTRFDTVFLYFFGGRLTEFNMTSGENQGYVVNNLETLADEAYRMAHAE